VRKALAGIGVLVLALLGVTAWSLEAGGVAAIETRRPDGRPRTTHVWYVVYEGELWVEAGAPENAWFADVQRHPVVRFTFEGRTARYLARPSRDDATHPRLRKLLRAKYGLRDRWVGLFVDGSRSLAVRLYPAPRDEPE